MNKLLIKAFTLIELLVVIAVIGILSGLIVVSMNGVTSKANIAKAQVFSNSLRNSLMLNMIAEYRLDGNVNDSWGSSNGTLKENGYVGACDSTHCPQLQTSNCVYEKCFSFDGINDYIDCGNSPNLNISSNIFTISAWIKTNYNGSDQWVYGFGEHIDGKDRSLVVWKTGKALMYVYPSNICATSITNVNDGKWHYLVGTVNGTISKIYVDGELEDSKSPPLSAYVYDGAYIGVNYISTSSMYYFNGVIDEVRIYNAAIPSSQIKEQYYSGLNNLLSSNQVSFDEYREKISSLIQYSASE